MVKYVEILFRFKVRFAFLLVVLPAVVGTTTILLMPSYKASATLWVDSPSYFGGATPSGWSIYLTPAQNEADTFNQQMGTREFGNQLYKQLADRIPDPTERIHAVVAAKLFVLATGTHLLSIVGSCDRPQICVTVVDTAIIVLRNQQIDLEKSPGKGRFLVPCSPAPAGQNQSEHGRGRVAKVCRCSPWRQVRRR